MNETSFNCGLRKRNNWIRDACVDRPGNTTITMTSTLLRRPWPPSLPTNHSTLVTLLSHARLSKFPCSVLWSSVRRNGLSRKRRPWRVLAFRSRSFVLGPRSIAEFWACQPFVSQWMGLHSSAADEKDHLFWVPNQLQTFWHVEALSVSEWDFIHLRLTKNKQLVTGMSKL